MVSPRKNETSPTNGTESTPARCVCRKKLAARNGTRPCWRRSEAFGANCFFAFMLFSAVPKAFGTLAEEPAKSLTAAEEKHPENQPDMETRKFGIVIHGGAGTIERANMTPEKERNYRAGLERALRAGYD